MACCGWQCKEPSAYYSSLGRRIDRGTAHVAIGFHRGSESNLTFTSPGLVERAVGAIKREYSNHRRSLDVYSRRRLELFVRIFDIRSPPQRRLSQQENVVTRAKEIG